MPASAVGRIRVSRSVPLELARENLVFIPMWVTDGFQRPRTVSSGSRGPGSASGRAEAGKAASTASLGFHLFLASPPQIPQEVSSKKEIHKIKSCKEAKASRFCCMEKRKRTIWMRKRRHKMYVK